MSEERTEVPAGPRTVADLDLKPALEAVLMVVDEPATAEHLSKILERPKRQITKALRELADEYAVQGRGFELRLIAGGGGSTPGPSTPPPSSGSCSTGSRPGSRRPRWRHWPWSRTGSR